MEYFLGLLTGVVFLITLGLVLFIGYRMGQRKKPIAAAPVDEVEQQRIQRFNQHFKELFQYDVDKALERKKVDE
jgi:hypothetical protein